MCNNRDDVCPRILDYPPKKRKIEEKLKKTQVQRWIRCLTVLNCYGKMKKWKNGKNGKMEGKSTTNLKIH